MSQPSETLRRKFDEKLNGDTEVTEPDRLRLKSAFAESVNLFVILKAADILVKVHQEPEGEVSYSALEVFLLRPLATSDSNTINLFPLSVTSVCGFFSKL